MACDTWAEKLDAYVDGELPEAEASALALHIRECSSCAAQALERVQMKKAVGLAGRYYEPSTQFRNRMHNRLRKEPRRATTWGWQLVVLPAALILIISLATMFYVNREKERRQSVFGELADVHVATLASSAPVEVVSTDRHTVKPWFEGKIPFSFNLPELQGTDFTLIGGRVSYLDQAPGAQLVYRIRKHEVSVFIFQERGSQMAAWASEPVSQFSFTFETWTRSGLRYFVVGDVGPADIDSLSKLLRDAG